MNQLTLNGVRSTFINGLLISSLPPISKPLMRTQIDTVDGRDGDIVTNLGYSAYDKTVEIGLHGQFDIDEVIAYFEGSGKVVFSNEPDKYYNYQIIKQIDYERLIRFRKANVVFHVQPYKYSAVDAPVVENGDIVYIVNMGNTISKPVITVHGTGNIVAYFNNNPTLSVNGLDGTITLDTEKMEAYDGNTLKNRLVIGDYDKAYFMTGENKLSFSGNVTQIEVDKYSRWI